MPDRKKIPYRIRLGVVGRRLHLPEAALTQKLDEFLGNFPESPFWQLFTGKQRETIARLRQEGTTEIVLELLSPLAEGADRLAARSVLARESRGLWPKGSLRAVLPLPEADYLCTFEAAGAKEEFHQLLAQSRRPVRLHTDSVTGGCNDRAHQEKLLEAAYDDAGEYVVDHCDLLIALWDGQKKINGHDGTYKAVQQALTEGVPVYRIWEDAEELMLREPADAFDAGEAYKQRYPTNLPQARAAISADEERFDIRAADGIDRYNRLDEKCAACAVEERLLTDELFGYQEAAIISENARRTAGEILFPDYCRSSVEALEAQKSYYWAGLLGYAMATLAVLFASLGVLFKRWEFPAFAAELVTLILLLWKLWSIEFKEKHRTWIEYRFVTERLRAAIFMALCGVDPKPVKVPEYMGHSQSENDWTIHVVDEIWSRVPDIPSPDSEGEIDTPHREMAHYIRVAWIWSQRMYHARKAQKEGTRNFWLSGIAKYVLPLSIVAAVIHLTMMALQGHTERLDPLFESLHFLPSLAALVLPAAGAALTGYLSFREHQRLELRSSNMTRQLEVIDRRIADARTLKELRDSLRELDEEIMLRETQDWLMLMKYVEIKAG